MPFSVQYMHLLLTLFTFDFTHTPTSRHCIIDRDPRYSHRLGSSSNIEDNPTPDERVWVICLVPVPECFPASNGWDGSIGSSDLIISLVLILQLFSLSLFSIFSSKRWWSRATRGGAGKGKGRRHTTTKCLSSKKSAL